MTAVFTASFRSLSPAGRAAGIDQSGAAHVAVRHLITGEIDRMIAREIGIDLLVRLSEVQRVVAAVVLRQLLFDDVGLDRDAQMIRLSGQIRRIRDSPPPSS